MSICLLFFTLINVPLHHFMGINAFINMLIQVMLCLKGRFAYVMFKCIDYTVPEKCSDVRWRILVLQSIFHMQTPVVR